MSKTASDATADNTTDKSAKRKNPVTYSAGWSARTSAFILISCGQPIKPLQLIPSMFTADTVIKPDKRPAMQRDMFTSNLDLQIDEPYVLDPDIDYVSQDPWRCSQCGLIFNAPSHDWNKAGTPCKNPDCNNTFVNSHVFIMALSNTNETMVRINSGTRDTYGQVPK